MRLVVDLTRNDDDQVRGAVTGEAGEGAVAFSGWLEFIRVLEAFTEEPPASDAGRDHSRREES